jgi:membrane-associated phospholipid phosphatase
VLQVNGWDRKVSNWARGNTPVFGSQRNALKWSDDLRSVSTWSYVASVAATPGADEPGEWIKAKTQGLAVGLAAVGATNVTTAILKRTTDRTRPNGADTESFPSGHASHSSVTTSLARYNLSTMEMNEVTRRTLGIGLDLVTVGTAWARVEAGAHYPSDSLVGIAAGSFFSDVLNSTFLGSEPAHRQSLAVVPLKNGAALNWSIAF